MYSNTGYLPCIHKGHLVPAQTYSFDDDQISSTFTYTNAVPQYATFNSGKWSAYEERIREYARNKCSPRRGDLYLLTGTSDIRITDVTETTFHSETAIPNKMPEEPKIVIPNSMWTAGCCVRDHDQTVLGAFAVIGNNDPVKRHTFRLDIKDLEKELAVEYKHHMELFPGKPGCSDKANDDYF